jgi:hypothetical protein
MQPTYMQINGAILTITGLTGEIKSTMAQMKLTATFLPALSGVIGTDDVL